MESRWLSRSVVVACLIGGAIGSWYAWNVIDWYAFTEAAPPNVAGDVPNDPSAQLMAMTIDGTDVLESAISVAPGVTVRIEGRLQLNPDIWGMRSPVGRSARRAPLKECLVIMDVVCRTWTAPGEKCVKRLVHSVFRYSPTQGSWSANWTPPERHGLYLVRLSVAERQPRAKLHEPVNPIEKERLLMTFPVTVAPETAGRDGY